VIVLTLQRITEGNRRTILWRE